MRSRIERGGRRWPACLAAWFAVGPAGPAAAEIHDYMILRLLYLGTSCGVQSLERLTPPREDWRRFKATCRDVSSYPNGIFVTCRDIADDRSCTVDTKANAFDSLDLLRPKREDDQ